MWLQVPVMPQRLLPTPPPLLPVTPGPPYMGPHVTKTVYVVVERPRDEQELFHDLPGLLELIGEGPVQGQCHGDRVMTPGPALPASPPAVPTWSGSSRPSEQPAFMFSQMPHFHPQTGSSVNAWTAKEPDANAWPPRPAGDKVGPDAVTPAAVPDALEYEGETATDSAAMPNRDGVGLIDIRSGRSMHWR